MNDIKRIAVVANWRTGSYYFSLFKAMEYGITFRGELFSRHRSFPIGNVPKGWIRPEGDYDSENPIDPKDASDEKILEALESGEDAIFILRPSNIREENWGRLARSVDKIYFLYRRGWREQARSYAAVEMDSGYPNTGWFVPVEVKERGDLFENMMYRHLGIWERSSPAKINFCASRELVEDRATYLIREYHKQYRFFKEFPGELIAYEDFFTGENYKPYNRYVHTDQTYIIPDFDVTALFERDEVITLHKEQPRISQ